MPIPIIAKGVSEGLSSIPYVFPIAKVAAGLAALVLLKIYFGGARNRATRLMHSKVVMITGGTSGVGAAVVRDLASRGAQIILLTKDAPSDPFLVDYVDDLRSSTGNELIYAEQVDLSSLHSIRLFATKWVDNAPPRRLDMIILCASTMSTEAAAASSKASGLRQKNLTTDRLNEEWQVNYLANYHLLSILSPALRAQPPDRDVRIIFSTCAGYIGANLDFDRLEEVTTGSASAAAAAAAAATTTKQKPISKKDKNGTKPAKPPSSASSSQPSSNSATMSMPSTTKLALMIFAHAFQQHLSSYSRPDKQPTNTRVLLVDPGSSRTPGTRRWLTRGSLLGLLLYLITWPIWWLVLKSAEQGAQSYLLAAMEAGFSAVGGVDDPTGGVSAAVGAGDGVGGGGGGSGGGSSTGGAGLGGQVGVSGQKLIKECHEREILRDEVWNEEIGKRLWEFSQAQIERVEKDSALRRAALKKQMEKEGKKEGGEDNKKEKGPEY